MFKNLTVGTPLWSFIQGWGVVTAIDFADTYPIKVEFRNKIFSYTLAGFELASDKYQSLFWTEFEPPLEAITPPEPYTWFWLYIDHQNRYKVTAHRYASYEEAENALQLISSKPLYSIKESKLRRNHV